jgi:hypothetical protein
MALWHDPFDELITDLEHDLPPADVEEAPFCGRPTIESISWVESLIARDPAVRERLKNDPAVQRFQAKLDRFAVRQQKPTA